VPIDGILSPAIVQKLLQQNQFVTPTCNAFPYLSPGSNFPNVLQNAGILYKAGVPILAGTDSYIDPHNPILKIPFGSGLHAEFEYLVQAGVKPVDVLRGATTLAAKLHSLRDRGSIMTGLRADLLLISGNPLTNISNTRNIKRVWVGGFEYEGTLG
jgi:imidazolonepropionase-like amidohydrolase